MKKISFKAIYFSYLAILVASVIGCIWYVNSLLRKYEAFRPEKQVENAINTLVEDATKADFWGKYSMPQVQSGSYEKHLDVKKVYLEQYRQGELTYSQKNVAHEEDELYYSIENQGTVLAEVKLKAMGPTETKLAVLSIREWQIEAISPLLEKQEYTLSVPSDFHVSVNGMALEEVRDMRADAEITYKIKDVYFEPLFEIRDEEGNEVTYTIENNKVMAEFYNYILTLPRALCVELNGQSCTGTVLDSNRVRYEIKELAKPEILISDYYGNVVAYEGGDELPLTYMTINADSRYEVKVDGVTVPEEAVTVIDNPEYAMLADYVAKLPQICVIDIAILKTDAEISVMDANGKAVAFDEEKTYLDLTSYDVGQGMVPDEVSEEADVLEIAKSWSLFMSADKSFSEIAKYLISDSYQYEMAVQYATGEDITFTSEHSLANPAFTEEHVTNFVWITEDCFSVDISFVKHMVLRVGTKVDDPMNDRFYFVKYDDTEDGVVNPLWKIVGMKEIVNNAE